MNNYDEGDLVRITGEFATAAGVATDPGTVTVYYQPPSGTVTTLVYGTDAAVVKASTGSYYVDLSASVPGIWHYSFRGTGSGQSAGEYYFKVTPSNFF